MISFKERVFVFSPAKLAPFCEERVNERCLSFIFMEESLRKGEFGEGKEKKGERWKLCFLLRVPLSCRAKHGNGGRRRAFLPGQCLFRFTHCHSIGRRTIFHSDICHSIRRRTNFTPSTCRSPCRRTILVAAICPSHHHRTNRESTRGGARLLRLIVPGRRARQRVGEVGFYV